MMNSLQRQFIQRLLKLIQDHEQTKIPDPDDGKVYQLYVMSQSFMFKYMYESLKITDAEFQSIPMKHRYPLSVFMLQMSLRDEVGPVTAREIFKRFNYNMKKPDMLKSLKDNHFSAFVPWRTQTQEPTYEQEAIRLGNIDDIRQPRNHIERKENGEFVHSLMNIDVIISPEPRRSKAEYLVDYLQNHGSEFRLRNFMRFCDHSVDDPNLMDPIHSIEGLNKRLKLVLSHPCIERVGVLVVGSYNPFRLLDELSTKPLPVYRETNFPIWLRSNLVKIKPNSGYDFSQFVLDDRYFTLTYKKLPESTAISGNIFRLTRTDLILRFEPDQVREPLSLEVCTFKSIERQMCKPSGVVKMASYRNYRKRKKCMCKTFSCKLMEL